MDCSTSGFPVHHQLPEITQTHVHQVGDANQPSHSLLSLSPQTSVVPASGSFPISQFFASVGQSTRALASASVLPMNIQDWFPLGWTGGILAVQGILKSLPQHYSSKPSILWCSAFFMLQLLHPYMITGKTITLTIWSFVGKVMSLLFNTLSRFVLFFLPRSMCLLIAWLQTPYSVIFEPKKINSVTVSIVSPSICHEVMGPDAMIFIFYCWDLSQLLLCNIH